MRRVVVTGMGIASPLGSTVESAFERLKTYQNCIEYWTELDEIKNMPDAGNTVANDIVKTWKDGSVLKYRKNATILIFNDTANWNIYKISYIDTSVPWICFVYHEKNTYEKIVNVQIDKHKRIIPNDTSEFILLR